LENEVFPQSYESESWTKETLKKANAKGTVISEYLEGLSKEEKVAFVNDYLNKKLNAEYSSRPQDFKGLPNKWVKNSIYEEALEDKRDDVGLHEYEKKID
jgi:hypothetical protein